MSRKRIAVSLLTLALMGNLDTAFSAPSPSTTPPAPAPRTGAPLPPGRAATIKEAQADTRGILLGVAVTGGIFAAMLLLIDGDDTGPLTTTSSQ